MSTTRLGGGIYCYNSPAVITDTNTEDAFASNISGNSAYEHGGGIYILGTGEFSISRSTVSNNTASTGNGGGIYNIGDDALSVSDSTISGNTSEGSGGGIYSESSSTTTITNSVLSNNVATVNGGGIYGATSTDIDLTNATIAGNYAGTSGGGIYYDDDDGSLTAANSIISLNEKGTGSGDNIYGDLPATGNNMIDESSADLDFVQDPSAGADSTWGTSDDVQGNYRLAVTSDAVDAGSDAAASGITYDLDGNDRTVDIVGVGSTDIVDIGAYEYQGEIVVTTLDDDDSNDPYNQYVSLREALDIADAWAGDDTITFHENLEGTITLQHGQLIIDSDVTIEGPGAGNLIINANSDGLGYGESRVFKVDAGVTATFSGMTITNGYASGTGSDSFGGGIYCDAGSVVEVNNSVISNNRSTAYGGAIYGGLGSDITIDGSTFENNYNVVFGAGYGTVSISGTLEVRDSIFTDNDSYIGGAIWAGAAASSLHVDGSTFTGNYASNGGSAIYTNGCETVTVTGSTFEDNTASSTLYCYNFTELIIADSTLKDNTSDGGTIRVGNNNSSSPHSATITNSYIVGNHATYSGGGIHARRTTTINVISSVISGNTSGTDGGGIYVDTDTVAYLINSTVAGNSADGAGDGVCSTGSLRVYNSIVSLNDPGSGDDINGTYSGLTNLIGQSSANLDFVQDPGAGTDGIWGTSDDVQGNYRVAATSVAIDAGTNFAAVGIDYDLDGNPRIHDGGVVDIGAYEYQGEIVVTTLDDDDSNDPFNQYVSLREALAIAASWDSAPDTITFQDGLQGIITLKHGQLEVDSDVTIEGPGANLLTIDADTDGNGVGESRVFNVGDVTAAISGMTITGGYAAGTGDEEDGGGIYNSGSLILTDFDISGNTATNNGDGIYNDGTLTIIDVEVSDNITNDAALVFADSFTRDYKYSGIIDGIGTLTKAGEGVLILTGNNIYTGDTILSGGTLAFESGALGSGNIIFADDSTLHWFGNNDDVSSRLQFADGVAATFDVSSNNVEFNSTISVDNAGPLTKMGTGTLILKNLPDNALTTVIAGTLQLGDSSSIGNVYGDITLDNYSSLIFANSNSMTCSGIISGNGTLTKVGSGTLRLTGDHTYDGITTISEGTLQLGYGSTNGSVSGDIVNNSSLVFDNDDDLTYGGIISGSGSVSKEDDGVLFLTGNNSYTGGTTIEDSTLQLGNGVTDGLIVGDIDIDYGSILVFANISAQAYDGEISGSGGKVQKIGSGAVTLANTANSYTGGTTLSGGTLSFADGALGNSGYITFTDDATLQWASGNQEDISSRIKIDDDVVATLDVGSNDVLFGSRIYSTGTGALTKTGSGKLTLTGVSTYTGVTTVDAGTLQLSNGSTNGLVSGDIVNNAALIFANTTDLTYSYVLSGTGTLTKEGSGKLTLNNENTSFLGTTTVSAGELQLGDYSSNGGLMFNIMIDSGAELIFYCPDDFTYASVLSGSGDLRKTGSGKLTLTNDQTSFTGQTFVQTGSLQVGDNTNFGILLSNIQIGSNSEVVFWCIASDDYTYPGSLSGSGTLKKRGDGTLSLTGDSTSFDGIIENMGAGSICLKGATTSSDITIYYSSHSIYGYGSIGDLSVVNGSVDVQLTNYEQRPGIYSSTLLTCTNSVTLDNTAVLNFTNARTSNDGGVFVIIDNQGTAPVSGTFSGWSEGSTKLVGGLEYTITYEYDADTGTFGTGNDVALIGVSTPLVGPTGLTVDASDPRSVDIEWDPVSGATSYDVFRREYDGGWDRIAGPITDTDFTDDDVPSDERYFYGVLFRDANNDTSSITQSNTILALTDTGDYDGDGYNNSEFDYHGTDPTLFDSDGDFLGDHWEAVYGFNPLVSDDCDDDYDGDNLSNIEEFNNHTDPTEIDTDYDGVSDSVEIGQGSDPLDPLDFEPPANDMKAQFTLTVGDSSESESEWWTMHVGNDIQQTAPGFGEVGWGNYYLDAGESYDITLEHLGTDPDFLAEPPEWGYPPGVTGPNYDWIASIAQVGTTLIYWIDDPYITAPEVGPWGGDQYKLLQEHIWDVIGDPDLTEGKVAHLHIPQLDADVDSKNDDGFTEPVDNMEEDRIEQDSSRGKIIFASTGDIDGDGIVDSEDYVGGHPDGDGIDDGHFVPMTLRLSENIYEAQPYLLNLSFNSGDNTKLRIWKEDADSYRTKDDIIEWNTPISASSLGLTPGGDSVTVYIEALEGNEIPLAVTVEADVYGIKWSGMVSDIVHVAAIDIDLDTDSNNNGVIDGTDAEEVLEDVNGTGVNQVGKRIFLNSDDDNKNGKPDFQDIHRSDYTSAGLTDYDLAAIDLAIEDFDISEMDGYELWLSCPDNMALYASPDKLGLVRDMGDANDTGQRDYTIPFLQAEVGGGLWYKWDLGSAVTLPDMVYAEGKEVGEYHIQWRFVESASEIVYARDTVEINVEQIVYPFTTQDYANWNERQTTDWVGLEVADAWYIDKALIDYIMTPGDQGHLETIHPDMDDPTSPGTQLTWASQVGGLSTTTESYANGFTMEFDYSFKRSRGDGTTGYVQIDRYENDQPLKKLSFVGNSGVKFGGTEVAILDVQAMAAKGGGLVAFDPSQGGYIQANGNVDTSGAATVYRTEPLNKLMSGVRYGGDYTNMNDYQDASPGDPPSPEKKFYNTLVENYNRPNGHMKISWNASTSMLDVFMDNETQASYSEFVALSVGVLELQSHWGSGVIFSDMNIIPYIPT